MGAAARSMKRILSVLTGMADSPRGGGKKALEENQPKPLWFHVSGRGRPDQDGEEWVMPTLDRVLETALYVDDLERARRFYADVLALAELYGDTRMCAFAVGASSVLLLFRRGSSRETGRPTAAGTIPPHDGSGPLHVAFAIGREELPRWEEQLGRARIAIEGRTDWPRGGHSVYFRDPDGHLLELATPGLWAIY